MPNRIKPKRSYTANSVPLTTDLETHELAIRWTDNPAMFTKNAAGNIVSVTLGGGGGGGSSANIVEATTAAGFPATGASSTLYVATDASRAYRWSGSVYVEIGTSGGTGTDADLRALFTPAAPTSVTATGGNAQATVSWTAPSVLAQTPITDYTVQFSTNSGSTWTTFTRSASTATSATVTGLTNGTAHVFRVAAVNGVGVGSYSTASSAVTPNSASVPDAPTSLRNADNYWGCSTNSTMWNAPASNGGSEITGYVWRIGSGATTSVAPSSGSRPAGSYTGGFVSSHAPTGSFQVAAVNAVGTGPFASITLQQDCN
jgi:hypothetical protein